MLDKFLYKYGFKNYYYGGCGSYSGNPCEPPKESAPTNDGLVLDAAYANFLIGLIGQNPKTLHIKESDDNFASDYVVQNTAPAPHTLVFTSLLGFLMQHRASIGRLFLEELNCAMMSAKSKETSLTVIEKIEKPLHVFSMFRRQEKNTRTDIFSPRLFLNYLAHKIQLDTIFLQVLPAHRVNKEAILPLDMLFAIIEALSGLQFGESAKLASVVQTDYDRRGIIARK